MGSVPPKVSIVIAVYNDETYIGDAIESALSQSLRPLEVIVVDDGSTDGTAEVLKRYEDRITIVSQDNQGPGAARNKGIGMCRGEYVSFIDSDDFIVPEKSARQAEVLDTHPEVGLCYGICRAIDARDGRVIKTTRPGRGASDRSKAPFPPSYPTLAFLARREWLEKVGGYAEDTRLSEDTELRFKLWAAGCAFMSHSDVVGTYRIHVGSLSGDPVTHWQAHLRVAERHIEAMGERMSARARDEHLGFTWLRIACGHIAQKNRADAATALEKALLSDPSLLTTYSNWDLVLNHSNPGFPAPDQDWAPSLSKTWDSVTSMLGNDRSAPGIRLSDRGRSSEKAALAHAMYRRAFADGKGFRARKLFMQFLVITRGRLPEDAPSRYALQIAIGPFLTKLTVKLQRLIGRQGRQYSQVRNEHESARMD